jgi:hypothetical protein
MITGAAMLIGAAGLTAARFYRREPSRLLAARLADEKSHGDERFVTLATIGDAGPAEFVSRLRAEAAALVRRIDFRRDFPFSGERSILNSLIAALAAVIVFQLAFEWLPVFFPAPGNKLAAAAKRLAQEPRFAELAADISGAAQKLQRQSPSAEDKQAIIDEALKNVEDRIVVEQSHGADTTALQDAAEAIKKTMRETRTPLSLPWLAQGGGNGKGSGQDVGSGAGQKFDNRGGSGSGERQEEKSADKALDRPQQKTSGPQSTARGEKTLERPDHSIKDGSQVKPGGADEGRKTPEEKKGDGEGGEMKHLSGAKNQSGDGAKQSGRAGENSPAAPGEKVSGELNEKDLRYVIVQLPEEAGGNASGSRDAQGKKSPQAAPSANAPLARPDDPQAAGEKQMLPLEYRGLIR